MRTTLDGFNFTNICESMQVRLAVDFRRKPSLKLCAHLMNLDEALKSSNGILWYNATKQLGIGCLSLGDSNEELVCFSDFTFVASGWVC
jgi:hypothetical protein